MFDELVKQAKRLFSSKSNGGKQVAKLTDQLHTQKQVILALSIVLLLGYGQFRDHFKCQGLEGVDAGTTTAFCWINGTTTVTGSNDGGKQTHVGLETLTNETKQKIHQHNYMRSLWALLILLVLCSYLAQRKWAAIFDDEVLKALLQLKGSEESRFVKAAEKAKPYETLSALPRDLDAEVRRRQLDTDVVVDANSDASAKLTSGDSLVLSPSEKLSRKIELVDSYVNIYDHNLDYYPNQLIYLLLTKNTAAYKMCSLKLRQKLVGYTICSTVLTLAQFGLPLIFIGRDYSTYGFSYLLAICQYLVKLFDSSKPIIENSIDYELSSSIFPVATQCEFKQNGFSAGIDSIIVQCTVAINEICSKLFVIIWWFVVINIFVEFYYLAIICFSSINYSTLRWVFGLRYWPQARREANLIATFRYRRNKILLKQQRSQLGHNLAIAQSAKTRKQNGNLPNSADLLDKHEQKRLEAEQSNGRNRAPEYESVSGRRRRGEPRKWYLYNPRDLCVAISDFVCCSATKRRQAVEVESEKDLNVFYLLYLIYLRLNRSRTRVEEVIRMSSQALNNYLDDLARQRPKTDPVSESNSNDGDDDDEKRRKKAPGGATIIDVKM